MIHPERCPRCEQLTLPHDMHDERVCGDCCGGCRRPADPVLLALVLDNLARDIRVRINLPSDYERLADHLTAIAAQVRGE